MSEERVRFPKTNGEGTLAGRFHASAQQGGPGVLFAHCFTCSKDIRAAVTISRALSEQGMNVLRFDFSGLGDSDGEFADSTFSNNREDLLAAAEYLRGRGFPPELLVGHSLGGAAVLSMAGDVPECRAVATLGAPADPAHVAHLFDDKREEIEGKGSATVKIAGRSFEIRRDFITDLENNPLLERIGKLGPAVLICHAPGDTVVGAENAKRLYEAAKHPKSFLSLDTADHLLSKTADADYAASVIACWARRYIATKPKPLEGLVAVRIGHTKYLTDVVSGAHHLIADEPATLGGEDKGPSPYDFLLAALGTCTAITLRMYADRKKWKLDQVDIALSHQKIHAKDCEECETQSGKVDELVRTVKVSGELTEEQRSRLIEIADLCPVHKTLSSEIRIVTNPG